MVSAVFSTVKEREGAYDMLENEHFSHEALVDSMAEATASRCAGLRYVYVPVDGSSLTLPDHGQSKDFGAVGTNVQGARGLKVIDALAVDPDGVVVGWLALQLTGHGPTSPERGPLRALTPEQPVTLRTRRHGIGSSRFVRPKAGSTLTGCEAGFRSIVKETGVTCCSSWRARSTGGPYATTRTEPFRSRKVASDIYASNSHPSHHKAVTTSRCRAQRRGALGLIFPRFRGHPNWRDNAPGVIHGQAKEAA